jgi:hypothetical protein
MGKQFSEISEAHQRFIAEQHILFVGTADATGYVNVSPKGMDSIRILSPNRALLLNLTGSGNESAAHVAAVARMTVMFTSFTKRPNVMRLYCNARAVHRLDDDWATLSAHFPDRYDARQIFDLNVEMVQTSCGYSIPFYEYQGERDTLDKWSEDKGPEGVETYWRERNTTTLNGKPTDIVAKSLEADPE